MTLNPITPDYLKCINDNEKQGASTFTLKFHHFTSEHKKKLFKISTAEQIGAEN